MVARQVTFASGRTAEHRDENMNRRTLFQRLAAAIATIIVPWPFVKRCTETQEPLVTTTEPLDFAKSDLNTIAVVAAHELAVALKGVGLGGIKPKLVGTELAGWVDSTDNQFWRYICAYADREQHPSLYDVAGNDFGIKELRLLVLTLAETLKEWSEKHPGTLHFVLEPWGMDSDNATAIGFERATVELPGADIEVRRENNSAEWKYTVISFAIRVWCET